MLRLHAPSGSIEALPQQEARVRALSNAQLVRELVGVEPDPFALAEATERSILVFIPQRGWPLGQLPFTIEQSTTCMSNPVSGCVPKLIAVADRATRGAIDAAEPLRLLGEALVLVGGVTALMLACLEALRWGNADLYKFVPDGERRVQAVITAWGLNWPQAD